MFDYEGQTEEELVDICNDRHNNNYPSPSWTAEVYSIGKCLRDTTGYPSFLPLNIYTQHGPNGSAGGKIPEHEYKNNTYCLLVSSSSSKKYGDTTPKKTIQYEYPIITYRRKHGINQANDARGTIVFPDHSIPGFNVNFDYDDFCNELNNLSEEYKPVCICLHYHDINKGQHKEFIKRGFPVYSAGTPYSNDYIDKFYNILKNFKYSMSNAIGSHVYYSIEMGIPFSLIGKRPNYYNESFGGQAMGDFDIFKRYPEMVSLYKLFCNTPRNRITLEQKIYVYKALGIGEGVKGKKLGIILWIAYLKYFFSSENLKKSFQYVVKHPAFFLQPKFWKGILK